MNFRNEEDKNVDLQNMIRNVFIDLPSEYNIKYNFTKYPPKTSGQIGVPLIIDSLLGNATVISPNETNQNKSIYKISEYGLHQQRIFFRLTDRAELRLQQITD